MRIAVVLSLLAAAAPWSAAHAQQSFAASFPARILAAHNAERARASVPPLVWDDALGTAAATYATQMAMTGRFAHSDRAARPGTGENLWMGTHGAFTVEAMVGGWSSEKRFFVPGIFPNVSRTRKLGRRRPLHADDLAEDEQGRLRARLDDPHRLSRLPLRL